MQLPLPLPPPALPVAPHVPAVCPFCERIHWGLLDPCPDCSKE